MEDHRTPDPTLKFKPDYKWPELGTERNCPADPTIAWQLNEDVPAYYGKPWWCFKCQFQFSEEDLTQGVTCLNSTTREEPEE